MNGPALALFLAATVLLSLGHIWGLRRNRRLVRTAFEALEGAVGAADRTFTRIGGGVGYHAVFTPADRTGVTRVEATMTLLAREAWLYYPVSRLTRRFDRLYVTLCLAPGACADTGEAHLIEERFARFRGPKIVRAAALEQEPAAWGGRRFRLYWETRAGRDRLRGLMARLPEPGLLRHVAVVPARNRVHFFVIPRPGAVRRPAAAVYAWAARPFSSTHP
ncbi:MAG: hypothetical protein JW951_01345 [Lentisphaerae bacterium]|nr:hypothetical protein [Lentisphaerota bacterium]